MRAPVNTERRFMTLARLPTACRIRVENFDNKANIRQQRSYVESHRTPAHLETPGECSDPAAVAYEAVELTNGSRSS